MTRVRRPALTVAALALFGLVLAGCTATGSGWMDSTNYAKRATFGFTVNSEPNNGSVARGSWVDGSVKFRFVSGSFDGPGNPCVNMQGTYTSTARPTVGQSGTFYLTVCDFGEPGVSEGDTVDISLSGGPFSGYSNSGPIRGGNVKINFNSDLPHPAP